MPLRALPMPGCAGRDSRSGSELPPFDPCTARGQVVKLLRVGHAVTGSPPGWESHPYGYRVVRNRSSCDCYLHLYGVQLSVNGSHPVQDVAPFRVRPLPAVGRRLLLAQVAQGVGEDRKAVADGGEARVALLSQSDHVRGERLSSERAEGIAEDAAEEVAEDRISRRPL